MAIVELTRENTEHIQLGANFKSETDIIVVGVMGRFYRDLARQAGQAGFDLVFTKALLEQNLTTIIDRLFNVG